MADFRIERSTPASRIGFGLIVIAILIAATLPFWADSGTLRLAIEIFYSLALAETWNLLAGYAGLVSIGQQAYVGLGGYVLFAATIEAGVHPVLAGPIAGALPAGVAS